MKQTSVPDILAKDPMHRDGLLLDILFDELADEIVAILKRENCSRDLGIACCVDAISKWCIINNPKNNKHSTAKSLAFVAEFLPHLIDHNRANREEW